MVMKRFKIGIGILIFIIAVVAIVVVALNLTREESSVIVRNESGDTALSAEKYQLLENSILEAELNHMNDIRFKNAWLILSLMEEIGFEEAGPPGQSAAGFVTRILEFLDVGVLQEVEFVRIDREERALRNILIMRVTNGEGDIYYLWFDQTTGLGMVKRGSEQGEIVYTSTSHRLHEGQLCEIDFENSTLKNCID